MKTLTGKMTRIAFFLCLFTSLGLIVAGFLVPPMGEIDGSVLKAVGELIVYPTLAIGYQALRDGLNAKFTKGDMTLEINKDDDDTKKEDAFE